MPSRTRRAMLAALSIALISPTLVAAQEFPSRRLQIVVPYSAGSGVDQLARTFGQALAAQIRQPVVVENREGATGTIGSLSVARAPADGYTVMLNAHPPFAIAPLTIKPAPYDIASSFAPIARLGSVPLVLITAADSPVRTFAQLKAYANANPGKATYASTGNGAPGQLYMEAIKANVDMRIMEVPYKSSAQALTDVVGGHILASLVALPAASQLIEQGRLRALGMGSRERVKRFADVPTLAELTGRADFEAGVWYGFLAPAQTPPERIDFLYRAIATAFDTKEVRDSLGILSVVPDLQAPAAFALSLRRDLEESQKMLTLVEKSKANR